jgi:hypothetical protein
VVDSCSVFECAVHVVIVVAAQQGGVQACAVAVTQQACNQCIGTGRHVLHK